MITSQSAYSILNIDRNEILSKDGSISLIYLLTNPEPYSLDEDKLNMRHDSFIKSFRNLTNDSYIHQQNIVIEDVYDSSLHFNKLSFLSESDYEHFNGIDAIREYTLITFTISKLKSLEEKYVANPNTYKKNLSKKDEEQLSKFNESVKNCLSIITRLYNTKIESLEEEEVKYLFKEYVNGFNEDDGLRDIHFDSNMYIGDNVYTAFSISDASYLPTMISNTVNDTSINIEGLSLSRGLMDDFGVNFPKNHIFNQVIHMKGHNVLKEEINKNILLYQKNKTLGAGIEYTFKRLKGILEEVMEKEYTLCRSHFSVITWDKDKEKLKKKEDKIKGIFSNKDIKYYIPSFEGLYHLFVGTIIGRVSNLHNDYFYLNTLENATSMLLNYSFYQQDDDGIVYQDRILQTPVKRDLWDAKKNRIKARNQIWYSPTGGGKSANAQHMIQQFFEQGLTIVVAEFGNSFEHLTMLYPNESVHIKVDQDIPLGVNPFDLNNEPLTGDKIYSLSHVILKFWRLNVDESAKEGVSVVVRKFIQDYYSNVFENHSFPSFYQYVKDNFYEIVERTEVPRQYFDYENFILVCSEFMAGGIYENICKGGKENENLLIGKRLVVFEMSGIEGNSFLTSVILSILKDTFNEKILSNRAVRGLLVFDEFAKTQELTNDYNKDDVLSTVAHACQTIRKENGGVILIYQSPSQLPQNRYAENIIDNTQIIGVLEANEKVYNNIVKRHELTNQGHINLMKSLKNNFGGKRPYSEVFLRYNGDYAVVLKLELNKRKLMAYQTEGTQWEELHQDFKHTQDFESSIINVLNKKDEENHFNINRLK